MFTLGGYDLERFGNDQVLTWNEISNDSYWTLKLKKADIGDTMIITSTDNAIVDSGTSNIAMPNREILSMVDLLGSVYNQTCTYDEFNQKYACECPDYENFMANFPSLTITLTESNNYEIPAYEFIYRQNDMCYIEIDSLGTADFWILGDPFMRQYYTIFDLDNY